MIYHLDHFSYLKVYETVMFRNTLFLYCYCCYDFMSKFPVGSLVFIFKARGESEALSSGEGMIFYLVIF